MRAPLSWLREYVDLPAELTVDELADRLTDLGLRSESVERPGHDVVGPLVVGRVLTCEVEPQKNGKTIRWCSVDVGTANGTGEPQGIVCGAPNLSAGDLVLVVLPGATLPGGFEIAARKTYGHVSAGMICSAREIGLGDDHTGIIVLPEGFGEPGDDAIGPLHLRDEVIEFEINPDRAYALSLRGVAREAALELTVHGSGSAYRDPALRETPAPNDSGYPVIIDDPQGCPVFVARRVRGVDPAAPTPPWMARRIQLAGMRPISLAVDVTNYVMLEMGHPIHGYDAAKLAGPIRVRRATAGERLTTLDGAELELSTEDLVVCDDTGPIGLGGVMGGESTEMSETTTDVLVEVASWDPVSMFRTGRRHRLTSEAGKRNERGVDPTIPEAAADRVVELLVAHGGGTADPGVTKVGRAPAARTVTIDVGLPGRVTGMDISAETVVADLVAIGCEVARDGDIVVATVPPWRPDLTDPFDLVEEVARIVGYANVPSVLPPAPVGRGLTRDQRLRRRIGRAVAAEGLVEVISFPFVGEADLDALGLDRADERRDLLRLANPLSSEEPAMTTTVLPGLLKALARNVGRGAADLGLFETATVTLPHAGGPAPILPVDRRPTDGELADLDKALPAQPLHLGAVMTGERERSGWWGAGRTAGWQDAVAVARAVAAAVAVPLEVRGTSRAPWHPGRCAELVADGAVIGHAGELHPKVCTAYGVPPRTAALELDLDQLMARGVDVVPAPAFSTYPMAREDVALVVDEDVPAAAVEEALRDGAGELLESIRLFDVYAGDQVGAGQKSLAFRLRFRAPDRTLTVEETSAARDAAVAVAAERCGAVQR